MVIIYTCLFKASLSFLTNVLHKCAAVDVKGQQRAPPLLDNQIIYSRSKHW